MAVRELNGSTDVLTLGGSGNVLSGWGAIYVIKHLSTFLAIHAYGGPWTAAGGDIGTLYSPSSATNTNWGSNGGDADAASAFTINSTDWWLIGFSKVAGALPRFHAANLSTGAAAIHTAGHDAGGGTSDNASAWTKTDLARFAPSGSGLNARYAVMAVLDTAYTDADFDAIKGAKSTASILRYASSGDRVWDFNQASTATNVVNLVSGTSDQTAITGTTVVTTDDPPGWTFGPESGLKANILPSYKKSISPAIIADYQETASWQSAGTPKATSAAITWQAGDLIVAIASDEGGNTPGTPTATGLSFTSIIATSGASSCFARLSTATAAAAGSSTVSATSTGSFWGMGVWVLRNHGGFGVSFSQVSFTHTVNATIGDGSLVLWATFDFSAVANQAVLPAIDNAREASFTAAHYSAYASDRNGTPAGVVAYGLSAGGTAGNLTILGIEIKPALVVQSQPLLGMYVTRGYPRALGLNLLTRSVAGTQPAATAQNIAVGQATETETASTITPTKALAVGQVTETETAQTITPTRRQTVAVGQATETETAQTVTPTKARAVGQVTETETAQTIAPTRRIALGQVTETETASTLTPTKKATLGQATETETAQSITPKKALAVGQAVETETAQTVQPVHKVAVGQATETETAQSITPKKALAVGQAVETETAQTITPTRVGGQQINVGQATETETAQSITPTKKLAAGQATETETAQTIAPKKSRAVGQVTETETAGAITPKKALAVGQVTETETASVIRPAKSRAVGQVTETETASTWTPRKSLGVGQALETETASTITPTGGAPIEHPPDILGNTTVTGIAYVTNTSGTTYGSVIGGAIVLNVVDAPVKSSAVSGTTYASVTSGDVYSSTETGTTRTTTTGG